MVLYSYRFLCSKSSLIFFLNQGNLISTLQYLRICFSESYFSNYEQTRKQVAKEGISNAVSLRV